MEGICADTLQPAADHVSVQCCSCKTPVGTQDPVLHFVKLFKWGLAIRSTNNAASEITSVQEIVSAQLLAWIEGQATYKVLISCEAADSTGKALMVSRSCISCFSKTANCMASYGYSLQT